MKKDYDFKDSFFKSRGFYIALYSSLAILIVVGIVASVSNIRGGRKALEAKREEEMLSALDDNLAEVNRGFDEMIPEDIPPISSYQDPFESMEEMANSMELVENEVEEIEKEEAEEVEEEKEEEKPKAVITELESPDKDVVADVEEVVEAEAFEAFVESDKMSWPIIGEIVMDYSIDHVVYDKTLDHYRTNDSLWISGEVGDQIKATADGVVSKVIRDSTYGNAIVIDNGNGWSTTYAQLQDNILVVEGDVVRVGQVIGGMSKPTNNAIVQGTHLNLSVSKDQEPIDPKLLLAQ